MWVEVIDTGISKFSFSIALPQGKNFCLPPEGGDRRLFKIKHVYVLAIFFFVHLRKHLHMNLSWMLAKVRKIFPFWVLHLSLSGFALFYDLNGFFAMQNNSFIVLFERIQAERWSSLQYLSFFFTPEWSLNKCIYENPQQVCVWSKVLRWPLGPIVKTYVCLSIGCIWINF